MYGALTPERTTPLVVGPAGVIRTAKLPNAHGSIIKSRHKKLTPPQTRHDKKQCVPFDQRISPIIPDVTAFVARG